MPHSYLALVDPGVSSGHADSMGVRTGGDCPVFEAEDLHMAARHKSIIEPRGLNIRQAAAYWGVSPGTFKKLVGLGLAPAPIKLPGVDRNIFDRLELDRAMDAARAGVAA